MPYFSWDFSRKMRFKQKLQIGLYFVQHFNEIFHFYICVFFTFIDVISHLYKLHTPQGVHVTNTWSNLAFWCKENPNDNMLYFGIETWTSKSKRYIFFCKILHFPIESNLSLKRFQKDCCNTSRNNLDCNEETLSNQIICISRKGIVSYFKQ